MTGEASAERHSVLQTLAGVAAEAGADRLARDASDLAQRIARGRFFVACVGQFKRGKSTLLNALVGREILPTGVLPVTTVVTILRYGPAPGAQVRLADGRQFPVAPEALAEFVSETNNPENRKGVAFVEVTVDSPLLASGMCLVDTPGLGSVFAANAETTRAFVPQIDAALVVLGTDPPISGEELALVEQVAAQVDHLVLVLNKCDRVNDGESLEAAAFTSRIVEHRVRRGACPVYRVSALEQASGSTTRDWPRLEEALEALAGKSAAVVEAATARGLARLARTLLRELDEQRAALVQPLEQTERRLAALHRTITEADCALRELAARMRVEQVALAERFAALRRQFLSEQGTEARAELERIARAEPRLPGSSCRARVIELAHEVASRRVATWVREIEPQAEALYGDAVARFVVLANDFVVRLGPADSAGSLAPDPFVVERGFSQDARFFFTSLLTVAAPGFWAWALDRVTPRGALLRSSVRQACGYLDRLMTTNSARMANDLTARVEESQRRLTAEIRARISYLVESAERALARARVLHASGEEAVKSELVKIDGLCQRVKTALP